MSIKQPIYHEFDLNATSGSSRVISLTHTDDAHVDVIELCVKQNGSTIDLTGSTVIARMVLHSTADILLNDSVPCTINSAGNILIPFDNAAVQTRKGIVKIEVNITRTPDILTLQLPLWVKINGSILDDATVDPHSEGTIPELLEEVREELERVEGFATAEDVFEILDSALEGNPSVAPTLLIDNTVDQQFNPDGHWIMYYIDSDDLRHNIFDFANLPSGTSNYTDLQNKPQINSHTLSGNKSSDDLGLQKKLTAGTNITIANDGTISASGGVTSYEDLTDKPVLRIQTGSITENITIEDVIRLTPFYKIPGTDIIALDTSRLYSKTEGGISSFTNFDRISDFTRGGVVYCNINAEGIPSFINARDRRFVVYHFEALHDSGCAQLIFWVDNTSGESKSAFRVGTGGLWQASNWVELTGGGSQIVSGVVNQNGTITFTDSDGNTFTTSGGKLVTSGNQQISMGYDSGGFYFLFDDGQEAS